jgi:hypothetical protein
MIGLWLYENGHFTRYPRLAVRWAIYQIAAAMFTIYFVIGLTVELKFFRVLFVHFGLIDDKELNEKLACNSHLYKAASTCIVVLYILCGVEDKCTLFLNTSRSSISKAYLTV